MQRFAADGVAHVLYYEGYTLCLAASILTAFMKTAFMKMLMGLSLFSNCVGLRLLQGLHDLLDKCFVDLVAGGVSILESTAYYHTIAAAHGGLRGFKGHSERSAFVNSSAKLLSVTFITLSSSEV